MLIQRGFTTDGTGEKLTPFPGSPGSGQSVDTDDQEAEEVPFDNSGTDLTATDVQAAIEELSAQVASCCTPGGGQFSSGDLLSTGEVDEISGAGKQDQIYPGFVTPVDGDYAWINQGGASVTVNANGGIHLRAPASAALSLRIRKKAAPSTPYTITAAFIFNLMSPDSHNAGLVWRQSSDGKLIYFFVHRGASNLLASQDFTSPTAFSANNVVQTFLTDGVFWLRMTDNGTNRIIEFSTDGYNFITLFTEGRTVFLTADEVGFCANSADASWPTGVTLLSWEES